jgi:hypothetical protein
MELFIGIGLALVIGALRSDAARERSGDDTGIGPRGPREAVRRYIGPVDRSHALLNPPLRVLLELVCVIVLSAVFLDETLSPVQLIGGALIALGALIIVRSGATAGQAELVPELVPDGHVDDSGGTGERG